ncbi:hypothetical protein SLS60_002690 [Paraconiothyrium brasiliense]|uniref:Uncharacterized protein n=1 Tax=Paraconiothyrium brasiliense TaxID=300254 RepID=A0ABR3RUI5_9PLEO
MSSVLGVDSQPRIFLGVWINWSKGNVLGSTLTVTQTNGALLVAFVALFITFAGTRLWRISCFFLHRGYSASGPQDGIYHQRQAVLKNSDNATAGLISCHFDMGFNAPSEKRFLYRRTTLCAPLVTEGYKGFRNFSESGAKSSYAQYSYGATLSSSDTQGNVTYIYPQLSVTDMFGKNKSRTNIPEYTLGYSYANVINGSLAHNRAFTPIDQLYRSDADVSVFFLSSNQVISPVAIEDPWYSAHQEIPGFHLNFTGWHNLTLGGYFGDEPAAVLGCAKQYQICYPDKGGKPSQCSRFGGKQELYWLLTSLTQNEEQLNRTRWSIMSALTGNELDGFVQTLGAASLTSRYSLVSGIQGPLPDNQWQVDVEHWHAATMVAIQGSAVDAASGPSNPDMRKFWAAPSNDQERSVCNNQTDSSAFYEGSTPEIRIRG